MSGTMGQEAATAWIETWLRPVGDLFINLIRMLIVPLIFTTLVAGVIAMGKPSKLGSLGLKTIAAYFVTTIFANVIGLTFGTLFRPGIGVDFEGVEVIVEKDIVTVKGADKQAAAVKVFKAVSTDDPELDKRYDEVLQLELQIASIKQAIRNVADENELPLSSIRVWVDIF
mgnify:CR=1 FL=1